MFLYTFIKVIILEFKIQKIEFLYKNLVQRGAYAYLLLFIKDSDIENFYDTSIKISLDLFNHSFILPNLRVCAIWENFFASNNDKNKTNTNMKTQRFFFQIFHYIRQNFSSSKATEIERSDFLPIPSTKTLTVRF